MYKWVGGTRRLYPALLNVDRICVIFTVTAYAALLCFSYLGGGWQLSLTYLALSALPFAVLSVARRLINAPRPAELLDVSALGEVKQKRGRSMPSRHVFSAFLIGTLLTYEVMALGVTVLILGVCIGASRVLTAKHFVRDCVAGAISGAVSGLIGIAILVF
jgi:membrane-associated phospholipid phosphatase